MPHSHRHDEFVRVQQQIGRNGVVLPHSRPHEHREHPRTRIVDPSFFVPDVRFGSAGMRTSAMRSSAGTRGIPEVPTRSRARRSVMRRGGPRAQRPSCLPTCVLAASLDMWSHLRARREPRHLRGVHRSTPHVRACFCVRLRHLDLGRRHAPDTWHRPLSSTYNDLAS